MPTTEIDCGVSAIGVSFILMNVGQFWAGEADRNVPAVLPAQNLLGEDAPWMDGRSSAGAQAVLQKNNRQLAQDSDSSRRLQAMVVAAVQRDRPALQRYLQRLTEALAFITWPACIGLALVADEFIRVVLGPTWVAAIVPLKQLQELSALSSAFFDATSAVAFVAYRRNMPREPRCDFGTLLKTGREAFWGLLLVVLGTGLLERGDLLAGAEVLETTLSGLDAAPARAGEAPEMVRLRAGRAEGAGVGPQDLHGSVLPLLQRRGEADGSGPLVAVEATEHGSTVTVAAPDRVGLIAGVTGALNLLRLTVRSARAWEEEGLGVSAWEVAEPHLDPAVVRERVRAVLDGRAEPRRRQGPARPGNPEPVVLVHHEASAAATVLEVRGDDRPGVVHDVCAALAGLGLSISSAHVTTVGPQAVDVFYVVEPGAGVLRDDRAAEAVHAVRAALSPTVTLGH